MTTPREILINAIADLIEESGDKELNKLVSAIDGMKKAETETYRQLLGCTLVNDLFAFANDEHRYRNRQSMQEGSA